MSLAEDVYFELTLRGLAPAVPFCASGNEWREPIVKAVGDADDLLVERRALEQELWLMRESRDEYRERVRSLQRELQAITSDRDRLAKLNEQVPV